MFTLKCYKHNGVKHGYEAIGYTINPPVKNDAGEIVTTVESWQENGDQPMHHVCKTEGIFYKEIYIENSAGKTVEVIRGSSRTY